MKSPFTIPPKIEKVVYNYATFEKIFSGLPNFFDYGKL